jgi:2,3-bisphosphoglycerate-dependent phosphoglycerate mutase
VLNSTKWRQFVVFSRNVRFAGLDQPPGQDTRILLMRHAETAAPDRFHGAESDIGLGLRGHEQAEALAAALSDIRPALLFSSPMRRALETAARIAETCSLAIEVVPELYERRMGELSGTSKAEGWHLYADEKSRWMAGELDYTRAGGETFAEVRDRALGALLGLVNRVPGQTIAVVAHGVLIKIVLISLLERLEPADFDRIGIDTASVNDLRWDGVRWRAEALNARADSIR